jgi:predicted SAM-dependent methyltransferase
MSTRKEIKELVKYCKGEGLNIGCGPVPIGNSIGVDISEKASAAKMICPADNLSFVKDNNYDYIVCAACLEHIDRGPIMVLREWLRCIKFGGAIAVTVPDAEYGMWAMTGDRGIPGRLVKPEPEMEHLHAFTTTTLKLLFEFAGMEVIRCEIIDRRPSRPEPTIICVGIKTSAFK